MFFLQSSLGGAGCAEKEAGKIRAGVQRAQADRREAGEQGRAPKMPLLQPCLGELEISPGRHGHQFLGTKRSRVLSRGSKRDPPILRGQPATRLAHCGCWKGPGGILGSMIIPGWLLFPCRVPPWTHRLLRRCSWGFANHRKEGGLPSLL